MRVRVRVGVRVSVRVRVVAGQDPGIRDDRGGKGAISLLFAFMCTLSLTRKRDFSIRL